MFVYDWSDCCLDVACIEGQAGLCVKGVLRKTRVALFTVLQCVGVKVLPTSLRLSTYLYCVRSKEN